MKEKDFKSKIEKLKPGKSLEIEFDGDFIKVTSNKDGSFSMSSEQSSMDNKADSLEDLLQDFKQVGIVESINEDGESYKEYFQKKLDKYGVKSPAELDADKKKEFFDEVDAGWKGEDEKPEANENIVESLETSILNFVATKDVDAFKSGLKDEFMTALGENEDFKSIQSDMMKFKG